MNAVTPFSLPPKVASEWLVLLTRKAPGSNRSHDTGHPDRFFLVFRPGICPDNTLNLVKNASFHKFPIHYSFIILSFDTT
jgi:hypothetical protein